MQHHLTRRGFVAASLSLLALPSWATQPRIYVKDGYAIGGFDTVAYFMLGKAVKGDRNITHEWEGAIWAFANADHREMFKADPKAFAPRFGGFCAFAASHGMMFASAPEAFTVYDGKLYLTSSRAVAESWRRNADANIKSAQEKIGALFP